MSEIDDLLKEIDNLDSESEAVKPDRGVEVEWLVRRPIRPPPDTWKHDAPIEGDVTESESSEDEEQDEVDDDRQLQATFHPAICQDLTGSKPIEAEDVISELQERLQSMKTEMDQLRLQVANVEEERDCAFVQLSDAEDSSRRRSQQMNLELQEARRRESSLQEQAEELQQNLEDALAEAKAAKAHAQELQKKLEEVLADKATAEAALENSKLQEEAKIKPKTTFRGQGSSLLDLREAHRQRLLLKLRNVHHRCGVRCRASSAELALQEGLRRLVATQGTFQAAGRPSSPSPPPVVLRGGTRRNRNRRTVPVPVPPPVGLKDEDVFTQGDGQANLATLAGLNTAANAKPALVSLFSTPGTRWADTGEKQFAADALRRAVFSLSLQGI